jgi:hypothetical protein
MRIKKANVNDSKDSSKRSSYKIIPSANIVKKSQLSINCSVGGKIN